MNIEALRRLAKNPHYKMSKEQQHELDINEKQPMVQFGEPEIHDNQFAKHETSMIKIKYENKKSKK